MRRWLRYLLVAIFFVFPVALVSLDYLEDLAELYGIFPSTDFDRGAGLWLISIIGSIPSRAIGLASETGYAGVFVLMLFEAAAFPIPSEIVLPFAGYLVALGKLSFWPVVFYSTLAALAGSFIDYYVGLKLGSRFLNGDWRLPWVSVTHLRRVQSWFDHYGGAAVALFRLVPAARVLISFPAGAYRMNRSKFALYTLAGCLPWNITLVYLGWWSSSSWNKVIETVQYFNLAAYALLVVLILGVTWKLVSAKRKHDSATSI